MRGRVRVLAARSVPSRYTCLKSLSENAVKRLPWRDRGLVRPRA